MVPILRISELVGRVGNPGDYIMSNHTRRILMLVILRKSGNRLIVLAV